MKPWTRDRTPMTSRRWAVLRTVMASSVPVFGLLSGIVPCSVTGMVLTTGSPASDVSFRRRRLWRRWPFAVLICGALAGDALVGAASAASPPSHPINAVGAENQYANVIAQIGGRYVHVRAVMSNPATDPHTYEASTGVAQGVAAAQLIVQN